MPSLPGVKGALHLCRHPHDGGRGGTDPCRHTSVFVNTGSEEYLEDNDIRGFLDGSFKWGWNQAEQAKVRMGRERASIRPPKYGEDELYRTLQRWSGVELPPGSRVRGASLIVHLKSPESAQRRLYLYPVRRDWNPGEGGVRGDNVSVPKEGEVWWGDARYGRESWGLPGAGFAARGRPDADTGVEPLAVAECGVDTQRIEFGGMRLASYVEDRVDRAEPLLFLIKLSDWQEDVSGSLIAIHSAEHGHERSPGLRPRLHLEWEPAEEMTCTREEVFLEYGRQKILPPIRLPRDARLWIDFQTEEGFESPALQYREIQAPAGGSGSGTAWKAVGGPVSSGTGWIQIRAIAARDPVFLGRRYRTRLRDTWVVSAPPEDQRVLWNFRSPSGERHEVTADYEGDFTWRVEFTPDEIGRWHLRWRHEFTGSVETGPDETFDVVPMGLSSVRDHIQRFTRHVSEQSRTGSAKEREMTRFVRLERAMMQELDPDQYRSDRGQSLRDELRGAREELWGRSVPEVIPMESHPLRTEVDGRLLDEPIPENDDRFRHEESGERERRWASAAKTLKSRTRTWLEACRSKVRSALDRTGRSAGSSSGEGTR